MGKRQAEMPNSPEFHPLTSRRWRDLERLFGPRGACAGCWCMWWRSTRREFDERRGDGNRRELKALVDGGVVPGILGLSDGEPVAWCSIAPRGQFGALNRSPVVRPIDDTEVWSIVCFFIEPSCRGGGLLGATIRAAVEYARQNGAGCVEAYPRDTGGGRLAPVSSYMGTPSVFEANGFVEVARRSPHRPILRLYTGHTRLSQTW